MSKPKRLDKDEALVEACADAIYSAIDCTQANADTTARAFLGVIEDRVVGPMRKSFAEARANDERLFYAALDNASETTTDLLDTADELDAAKQRLATQCEKKETKK